MLCSETPSPIGTRFLQIDVKGETFGVNWLMRKRGAHMAIIFRRQHGETYLQMLNNRIVPALEERYVLQASGTFLRYGGARRGPGSSQDNGDGTSSAAVSGPYNFAVS